MQIKISDLTSLLKNYSEQVGLFSWQIRKRQAPIKQIRKFMHWVKRKKTPRPYLTEAELLTLAKWLVRVKKTNNKLIDELLNRILNLYDETFLKVFKQIYFFYPTNPRLRTIFSYLVKNIHQISYVKNIIVLLLNNKLYKYEQIEFLITRTDGWEAMFDLLSYLHSARSLTNRNIQSVICASKYAAKIFFVLENTKNVDVLQILKNEEDFEMLCRFGDYADDFVSLYLFLMNYPQHIANFRNMKNPALIKPIYDACSSLKRTHFGSEEEDFELIFSCPGQANIICVLLTSFRSGNIYEVNARLRQLIKAHAAQLENVCGVIGVLFEKKHHHQVGIERVFLYANRAKVIAEILRQIPEKELQYQLEEIFPDEPLVNTAFNRAIKIFSEEGISHSKEVALICKHKQYADLYAQAISALHKAKLNDNELLKMMDENEQLTRIAAALFKANLSDANVLSELFKPTKNIQLYLQPFFFNTIAQNFFAEFENIDHPFCHFVLGKIYCGEMWGVDQYYSPERANQHFSAIPSSSVYYAESRYSLYNISLSSTNQLDNRARTQRLKLTQQLANHQHPAAEIIKNSLKIFRDDYLKRWYFSQSPMLLFKTINLPFFQHRKITNPKKQSSSQSLTKFQRKAL